ncbi:hypothetical protein Vadar_031314 [Vaccinium darrowii]|uniref:Uncharacterized protein n=1 Tax=Vaccinium darrowii TaxID=229202 RepID=A0ACB7XUL9_9ERIC|nr:hypothetical protein Vadar_031314 [Vaccinium darrowii]
MRTSLGAFEIAKSDLAVTTGLDGWQLTLCLNSAPLRCHTTKLVNPSNFYTSLFSRLRFSPRSPKQLLLLVERAGQKYLWIGKRSEGKQTYPGMLDHLPHGIACGDNIVKECQEEAGIPRSISMEAIPVGAVSYMDIDGYRYKKDVLFCSDLKLPEGFIPDNQDGEVESFKLIPIADGANVIKKTEYFKPNCNLVIMDFLFRHGYIFFFDASFIVVCPKSNFQFFSLRGQWFKERFHFSRVNILENWGVPLRVLQWHKPKQKLQKVVKTSERYKEKMHLPPSTESTGRSIFDLHHLKLARPPSIISDLQSPTTVSGAYGVHMNGYVERAGQKYLWPHGIACGDNIVKECEEEAGIPGSISMEAIPVGAVSYMDIDGYRYKRDVLFCSDLKLPEGFIPENQDGEVESFKLIPVADVANVIKKTEYFKPNCNLVILDFLFRHGYIFFFDASFIVVCPK